MTKPGARTELGYRTFVVIVASLMAMNAIGIDIMLPALSSIRVELRVSNVNGVQWIIAAYVIGLGAAQLLYGPLSDRFGRRAPLLVGLAISSLAGAVAAFSSDFHTMIAARVVQGAGAAGARVLAVSIVRDRYSGRQMARILSLAMMVFLASPILAPSIGQAILLIASWRWLFLALTLYAVSLAGVITFRLPETLHEDYRLPLSRERIWAASRTVFTDRWSIGYTTAGMLMVGCMLAYLSSSPQIFGTTFGQPHLFPIIFAASASAMAAASFLNARLVERFGTRRLAHIALLAFIALAALHVSIACFWSDTIWTFSILQGAKMACFALAVANFSAMAMEGMAAVAGTAAAVQGFLSSIGGALLGVAVSQSFDGTTLPFTAGCLLLSLAALLTVFITERGRLFVPHIRHSTCLAVSEKE
jgi:MFS transporter, DHA1 family, multidrug resistance protein